jgi:hypothetical protein
MGLFEDLNLAGLQAIGLNPEWTSVAIADATGEPDSASAGVYCQGSPRTQVTVDARTRVAARSARIQITTADLTTTIYTVAVGGVSVVYDASSGLPADADELVSDIVDAINGDAPMAAIVTASVDPDDEDGMTILLQGVDPDDYSFNAIAAGGTGVVALTADPATLDVLVYTTRGGAMASGDETDPGGWRLVFGGVFPVDRRGFVERFDTAGMDRLYVEVADLRGHPLDGAAVSYVPRIMIGPAIQ